MNPTGEPLTRCPVCRYSLTGLPKSHRCPECGFAYDESMRVWEARRLKRWQFVLILLAYGALAVPAAANLLGLARSSNPAKQDVFLVIVPALLATACVHFINRYAVVVASDDGVLQVWDGVLRRKRLFFSWRDIWIPDPDDPRAEPLWIGEEERKLYRLLLPRQRRCPTFVVRAPAPSSVGIGETVNLRAIERQRLEVRAGAMHTIRKRWKEALAEDPGRPA